jgi:hypothetical protein
MATSSKIIGEKQKIRQKDQVDYKNYPTKFLPFRRILNHNSSIFIPKGESCQNFMDSDSRCSCDNG